MAVSKVKYNGVTLINLENDTATAADVRAGKTFHLANGTIATGTYSGGGNLPANIMVTFNQTVSGVPPVTYAYRAPSENAPFNMVWTFKTVGLVDPSEFDNNVIPCVAHDDKIRDGFYVFVYDDQWIDGTGFVALHCASFNPLNLEDYNIADDDNVYYVIPTTDNITINIKDSNEE